MAVEVVVLLLVDSCVSHVKDRRSLLRESLAVFVYHTLFPTIT